MNLYLRLLQYIRPYKAKFIIAIIGMVVFAATEPALPALMQPMLDGSFINKDESMIVMVPILLILIYLVRGIASFTSTVALNWVSHKVVMDLRKEMFGKLITLPTSYYDSNTSGHIISKFNYDASQVALVASDVILIIIRDSLAIIGLVAWMFYIDWKLSSIIFIITPPIILIVKYISIRLRTLHHELQNRMGELTQILGETIHGQKIIKIFNGKKYETDRFDLANNKVRSYTMKTIITGAINGPVVQFITVIALAGIIYLASIQSLDNEITAGEFISFFGAMAMLATPIKRLTAVNEKIQRGLAAASSIFSLIDEKQERDNNNTSSATWDRHNIEIINLSFTYPDRNKTSLNNLNIRLEEGTTTAFVGLSGSGKSTLANLISSFYLPSGGEITIGDNNISEYSLRTLRDHISYVGQEVTLFNDTILANIAYGSLSNASTKEVIKAAKLANAYDFIMQFKDGFETLIGEHGGRLSGGQRQRISIARAILKDAPILILDEATSALDSESEKNIMSNLETIQQNKTVIIISHRLSTITKADNIVLIKDGYIVGIGDHSHLITNNLYYKQLYNN